MNKISRISFGATLEEYKAIRKACNNLSECIRPGIPAKMPVNTSTMQDRFFISAKPELSTDRFDVQLKLFNRRNDGYSTKSVYRDDTEGTKRFLKSSVSQRKIAEVFDELKALLRKMDSSYGE